VGKLSVGLNPIYLPMEERGKEMWLKDKRFWIFEGFTILYTILLCFLGQLIWNKTTTSIEDVLLLVGICAGSGFITYILASKKHWFLFGLIYEGVFLSIISCIILTDAIINHRTVFNDLWLDVGIYFVYIITIGAFTIIPTLILAFIGYKLFQQRLAE
jgi:hypothetical protein